VLPFGFVFAVDVDVQIEEALGKKQQEEMMQQAKDLNEKFTFTQVNSCASMDSVVGDFLELYKKYYPKRDYRYWGWDMEGGPMPIMMVNDAVSAEKSMAVGSPEQFAVPPT